MILILIFLLAGLGEIHGKLEASSEEVFLQPGETKTVTLISNSSEWSDVFLRTKLHHIATVAPERHDVDPSNPWWEVQISGHELGYTHVIAAINESGSFSFEEGVVHITVLRQYWLQTLSLVCGWVYFSAWTFSFYPQLLSNIRRKSVVGLNFDFLGLNELGYICYSIFNCCLYFVPSIQDEYFRRHPGATNPVFLNDVLFSVHGLLATTVMIIHCFIYERGEQRMSQTGVALMSFGICATGGLLLAATQGCLLWLDATVWISFVKLMVTMTKYVPQALMHYRLKSTEGWSIECILCDLTGSCFSLFQMLIISYNCVNGKGKAPPSPNANGNDKAPPSPYANGNGNAPPSPYSNGNGNAPPSPYANRNGKAPPSSYANENGKALPSPYANGNGNAPPSPYANGNDKAPPSPYANGNGNAPPSPYANGNGNAPPSPYANRNGKAPPSSYANENGKALPSPYANGNGNAPPSPYANGNGKAPPSPYANGNGNAPPSPYANGNGNAPPSSYANGNGNGITTE